MASGEIGGVYLGNWMRDFSQIGDPHDRTILSILNVLSMGEFNRPVTAEQVGGYLPTEHLDNPRGGGSVEDPAATGADTAGLSSSQRAWVKEQQTPEFKAKLAARARASHLPEYIEAGKEHARRQFEAAARAGRGDPDGQLAMGNGLHTVEDYFAHSNFTDACIYLLAAEGALPPESTAYQALQDRAKDLDYDPSGGVAGGAGRPEIMTGTYRGTGNKTVSLLEQLRSEVETGSLRKAAVLGAIRVGMVNAGQLGATGGAAVGSTALGGLAAAGGVLVEGTGGAVSGAAEGWQNNEGWDAVTGAVGGFFGGGAEGAQDGARRGWEGGSAAGGRGGAAVGRVLGQGAGAVIETAVIGGVVGLISAAILGAQITPGVPTLVGAGADALADQQTRAATAADRAAGDSSPNHSQLAKDDLHHPAFAGSRALAVHVDTAIGRAMIAAWNAGADEASVAALTGLVDRFVSNPADSDWWRQPLLGALDS
jgi:hypothetical protein